MKERTNSEASQGCDSGFLKQYIFTSIDNKQQFVPELIYFNTLFTMYHICRYIISSDFTAAESSTSWELGL